MKIGKYFGVPKSPVLCTCVCVYALKVSPKHFPNDKDEDVGYVLVVPKTHTFNTHILTYLYLFIYM